MPPSTVRLHDTTRHIQVDKNGLLTFVDKNDWLISGLLTKMIIYSRFNLQAAIVAAHSRTDFPRQAGKIAQEVVPASAEELVSWRCWLAVGAMGPRGYHGQVTMSVPM